LGEYSIEGMLKIDDDDEDEDNRTAFEMTPDVVSNTLNEKKNE
jgi:hypothetical protein